MKHIGYKSNDSDKSLEDILYLRLVKLIYSVKDLSETFVELVINSILFLTTLFKWIFQFKEYITSFFKYLLNAVIKISNLVTFENKIYLLAGLALVYLFVYVVFNVHKKINGIRVKYNNKWSQIINHFTFVFSPYIIFTLCIYLPLCIIIPKYYFENIIVKIWIQWIPLNKAIVSVYYSLLLNSVADDKYNNLHILDKLNIFVNICEKFSNTDIVINFLEYISNKISHNHKKNENLSLLNSKSYGSNNVVNIRTLQCWGDYFGLLLIYSFLKSYIISDTMNIMFRFSINYVKVMYITIINIIKGSIFNSNIIKYFISIKYISVILDKSNNALILPMYLLKAAKIVILNLNWKYLIISIIVLNILLQIRYCEIHDCKFSILFENNKSILDDESGDDKDEYDSDENDDDSSEIIIYEYPSLMAIIRNYLIYIIDLFTTNIFGMTLFGHIYHKNDRSATINDSGNSDIYIKRLEYKENTKSFPFINKNLSDDIRRNSRLLSHSKTMPELNMSDNNNICTNQLKIINAIENNILLNWFPDYLRKYYMYVGKKLLGKSNKFKYWILCIMMFICQIPQWVVLLFPSFIVNIVGCMLFGFIYPLIMILKINCNIFNNQIGSIDKKYIHKIQTWMIYLITFNIINEAFNINSIKLSNLVFWIPFKNHIYYLIILLLQLISSLIPVILGQSIAI